MAAIVITKENFDSEVVKADGTVLVDFWATWCGPCRMLSPIVDAVASEHPEIKVGKINVDEQPELAQQFGIMSIPTLIVFKNGEKVQIVGFGAFEVKERPARKARNPKTGEEIQIGARRSPMFKPGKALKEAVEG